MQLGGDHVCSVKRGGVTLANLQLTKTTRTTLTALTHIFGFIVGVNEVQPSVWRSREIVSKR